VVHDVGDGEVVAERGHHERQRGHRHRSPAGNAGAARSLAQAIILAPQRQRPRDERIGCQRQRQQQRKASNLRH